MNYLDYLSGGDQTPQNYVQPLIDQGVEVPAYEQPPVSMVPPADVYSSGALNNAGVPGGARIFATPSRTDSSIFNEMLTPTAKPLTSTDVKAAQNPFAVGGPEYIAPQVTLPTLSVSGSLAKKQAPFSSEMDKAIGIAQSATKKLESQLQPYKPLTDEYNKPIETAIASEKELSGNIQAYEQGVDNVITTQAQEQQRLAQETERINNNFVADYERSKQAIDDVINEKIDPTIDPGRFWANASTGQKVMMSIGLALSAMSPEANKMAIESINKAIERDIEAQKQTILGKMQNRKEKASNLSMAFDNAYKATGSQIAALETLKARSYQQAVLTIDQMSKKLSSREALANAQQARSQLELQAITHRQNAHNAAAEQANKNAELLMNSRLAEAQMRVQKAKIMSDEKIALSSRGGQAGQLGAWGGDEVSKEIEAKTMFAPKEMKEKAVQERAFLDESEELLNAINNYFDTYASWSEYEKLRATIPGTNEYNFVEKGRSILFQPATEIAKGALQGFEYESTIAPYIPSIHHSKEDIKVNKNTFKNLLYGKLAGKTPALKHYGVDVKKYYPSIREMESQRVK